MLPAPLAIREQRAERLREVLAELVAGPHPQRLAVAHHALARPGPHRAGELLALRLQPRENRDRHDVAHDLRVDPRQHVQGELTGLGRVRMRRMPLLPEELRGAQEQPRPQLPSHHVGPVVHLQRQIAVAVDPLGEVAVDDRLAGRADDRRLRQLPAARVRDDRELRAEPLDVLGLPPQVALGDQQREIGVHHAGRLDPVVELALQVLPDRVRPRPDHHRAAHRPALRELRLRDDVLVPAREVHLLRCQHGLRHGGRCYALICVRLIPR